MVLIWLYGRSTFQYYGGHRNKTERNPKQDSKRMQEKCIIDYKKTKYIAVNKGDNS